MALLLLNVLPIEGHQHTMENVGHRTTNGRSEQRDIRSGQHIRQQRDLQTILGPLGPNDQPLSCHHELSTPPVSSTTIAFGYTFAIASDPDDNDGVMITSLGFHIDPAALIHTVPATPQPPSSSNPAGTGSTTFGALYEAYVLTENGYYADPERDELSVPVSYDYRGDLSLWTKVAGGVVTEDDLIMDPGSGATVADYFMIPLEQFTGAYVPQNGGVRSFYVTLQTNGFQYADVDGDQTLNNEMVLMSSIGDSNISGSSSPPKLLIGEGIAEYPFPDSPYLYQPKLFVGKIYYETECESMSPSFSARPSIAPSAEPSASPSQTSLPSSAPSNVVSSSPSTMPSSTPSEFVEPVQSLLFLLLHVSACQYNTDGEPMKPGKEEWQALEETVTDYAAKAATEAQIVGVQSMVIDVDPLCPENRLLFQDKQKGANFGDLRMDHSKNSTNGLARWRTDEFSPESFEIVLGDRKASITIYSQNLDPNSNDSNLRNRNRLRNLGLQTSSSALDFSMIITGEYRPITRPGERPDSLDLSKDLGDLTEESINRDSDQFVKDLSARASQIPDAAGVLLTDAQSVDAVSVALANDQDFSSMILTRSPTDSPTRQPINLSPITDDAKDTNTDSKDEFILIGIVIIAGVMCILGAVLLYHHAKRRAIRKRRKHMERDRRAEEERKAKEEERRKWEEENERRHNLVDGQSLQELYGGGGDAMGLE